MNVCRSSCQTFPPSTSLLLPRHAGQLGAANHTIAILVKLLKGFDHIFCRHDTMNTERVPNGPGTIRVPLLYPELHGCGCGTHGITKTPYKVQVDHGSKRIQIFPATPWNWLFGFGVALSIKPSAYCILLCYAAPWNGNKRLPIRLKKECPMVHQNLMSRFKSSSFEGQFCWCASVWYKPKTSIKGSSRF